MNGKIPAEYHDEISRCIRLYNKPLYRRLFRLTQGDHALAQDLMQQVLMEAPQNWAEVRALGDDAQRNLLYRMAEWRAIDAFRKNSRTRDCESRMLICHEPPDADPHLKVITAVALERFVKTIEALPHRQAQAAGLYWLCGWTNAEIADVLVITPGAVTRLLHKAATTIRRELGPYLPFEPRDPEGGA